jgi:transcriptional regulator with XRE-family HTH domain
MRAPRESEQGIAMERLEHVGETIRHHRRQRGMTQEELARRAGMAPTSIVRLESGEVRAPRLSTLHSLARALQIPVAELVQHVAEIRKPTVLGEGMMIPDPPTELVGELPSPFTAVYERDGDWWIGYVEELPGANAQGETLEKCRESLREAVSLVLEANRELTRREFEGSEVVREPIGAAGA